MPAHLAPMPIDTSTRICLLVAASVSALAAVIVWAIGARRRMLTGRGLLAALGVVVTVAAIAIVPVILLMVFFGASAAFPVVLLGTAVVVWRIRSAIRRDPSRAHALDLGLHLGALGTLVSALVSLQRLRSLSRLPEIQRELAAAIAAGKRHAALQASVDALVRQSLAPSWTHLLLAFGACTGIAVVLATVLAVRSCIDRSVAPVILVLFVNAFAQHLVLHRPPLLLLVEAIAGALAVAYVRHVLAKEPDGERAPPVAELV